MKTCICGNSLPFEKCCALFIKGQTLPKTAVELMRSRYSAYVLRDGQYLYDTCSRRLQNRSDIKKIEQEKVGWLGLKIESFSDDEVTFMAYYKDRDTVGVMKEHSFFIIEDDRLKYDSGKMIEVEIGRNETCPCGSGKKYKKCCA